MVLPSIGNFKKQIVAVSDLQLDLQNFRTGSVSNQSEAINALISRNANKLRGLIASISENGFLDLETPCIFPDAEKPGRYIVAEGNRRITSLKLLRSPELAKNTPLLAEIRRLKAANRTNIPVAIECAVFGNKRDCLAYILMRHGYGTDGAGVLQWSSISKLRADNYVNGTIHQELKVLEFVMDSGSLSQEVKRLIEDDEVNITNLARLTDDAQVRAILGVSSSDCTASSHGEMWLLKVWQRITEIVVDGQYNGEKFTVDKNINTTLQRQAFVREVIETVHPKQSDQGTEASSSADSSSNGSSSSSSSETDSSLAAGSGSNTKTSATPKHGQRAVTTKMRKGLVPKSFNPQDLSPQKMINILDEMKRLEVRSFPNCSGVMFRVLIELGVEAYIKNNPSCPPPQKDWLAAKITSVAAHLEATNALTKKQLKPIRDIVSVPRHPISTDTLNAYVHNPHVSPTADTLKTEWDNIQHFIELLWAK